LNMAAPSAVQGRTHSASFDGRKPPIAVTHIITSLDTGGAEMMLLKLLGTMDRSRFRSSVIGLGCEGSVAQHIRAAGVPVEALGLRTRQVFSCGWQLTRALRRQRPQIVQTWMYHADLAGSLASFAVPGVPVIWNIRCGRVDRAVDPLSTRWISRACALTSRALPSGIICCSRESSHAHVAAGYNGPKMRIVPNGFDTAVFRPDPVARHSVYGELRLPADALLVGRVARFDAAKDYASFCSAAAVVHRADPRVHFVLCGEGVTAANELLNRWINEAGIGDRIHLLGRRDDMPRLNAALDLAVSSSVVEGFPNVLGEAMACGVPCVATDAGDSRHIVANTGLIAPVREPAALAASILALLGMPPGRRSALGTMARARVESHFGLAAVARQYEAIYEEIASPCAA
jgi:glycosyltransferase involved in cell wall biosynthesis